MGLPTTPFPKSNEEDKNCDDQIKTTVQCGKAIWKAFQDLV